MRDGEKKPSVIKFIASIFGAFGPSIPLPSRTRNRCPRCRRKYDLTKTKGAVGVFCSQACASREPYFAGTSRQQRFRARFVQEMVEARRDLGAGKHGYFRGWIEGVTRRNARRVARNRARMALKVS